MSSTRNLRTRLDARHPLGQDPRVGTRATRARLVILVYGESKPRGTRVIRLEVVCY